jgi:hypothetical protein
MSRAVVRLVVLAAVVIGAPLVVRGLLVKVSLVVTAVSQKASILAAAAVVLVRLVKLVLGQQDKVVMAVLGPALASLDQPYFMRAAAAVEVITGLLVPSVVRADKAAAVMGQTFRGLSKQLLERQILAVALAVVDRAAASPTKAKAVVLELSSSAIHSKLLDQPHLLLSS